MTRSKIPLTAGKLFILVVLLLVNAPVFAQSVDTAWVRRYNGPGNRMDEAYAIAVDDSGNVYVTGQSMVSTTNGDYATIKYYPNGDIAWVGRYDGAGRADVACAIAVDNSGNVYVTGYNFSSYADCNYGTIKYYLDGDTAWVRHYQGPGPWWESSLDMAYAIAVDDSGNVYVTGKSYYGYATIKYYPNGDTAWVRRYDGPGENDALAIAVDGSGNVYVTGGSRTGTSWDYATIKYYPDGDTA
jgi:hypothetical protein